MNRIDEIIAELCPCGVGFRELGDVVQRTTNIKWSDVNGEEFRYIDLTSVDRITHAIAETQTVTSENAPSRAQQVVHEGDVIFGTTRPMLKRYAVIPAEYDGDICSTGYCVLRPNTEHALPNFIFHLLGTSTFYGHVEANERGASYPAISDSAVKAFVIPVPPLDVQREIVKVLDTFTKLEAELEAELEARRRQYQYYRDALLSFDERTDAQASKQASKQLYRWMTLGEIGKFVRGTGIQKSDFTESGVGCIHYGQIHTHYGTWAVATKSFVKQEFATRLRKARTGDLVIATTSEDDAAVAKAVAWLGAQDVAVSTDAYIFHHSLDPKYASYFFQTELFQHQKKPHITGTKVRRISGESLAKIRIPVPPLEEQERIVDILDKFDALVNDLSTGLPAELKARRQQYEYYRDRLLTFREAT